MEARKNVNNTNRFLVTEYCKGGSLKDGIATRSKFLRKDMRCSTTIATWIERLGWALDIASALSYLKKHELYHGRFFVFELVLVLSNRNLFLSNIRDGVRV